ncbi:MAG: PepSY-like domain-containing protein [Treponema sp.]|nr:PepSY-like domain-containing protein [Treponema sp.]
MKKMMVLCAVFLVTMAAVCADRVISADKLPETAKTFIAATFPGKVMLFVEADFDEYEVQLNDGTEITFTRQGEWKEIESRTGIPASVLLPSVSAYITDNFPDSIILSVEKDWNNSEVKLSGGVKLYFSPNGDYLGMKRARGSQYIPSTGRNVPPRNRFPFKRSATGFCICGR